MTILISIHIWKRPAITAMCMEGVERIVTTAPDGIKVKVLIVYSRDQDIKPIQHYHPSFHVVKAPNKPLGRKHNLGLQHALSQFSFDYFMQLGSDDLLSVEFWDAVTPYLLPDKYPFFGLNSIYFYDSNTGKAFLYRPLNVFGAGRFIHRDLLGKAANMSEHVATKSWIGPGGKASKGDLFYWPTYSTPPHSKPTGKSAVQLWKDDIDKGLDTNSELNIARRVHGFAAIPKKVKHLTPLIIDVKSDENIHAFSGLPTPNSGGRKGKNTMEVQGKELDELPYLFPELKHIGTHEEHRQG